MQDQKGWNAFLAAFVTVNGITSIIELAQLEYKPLGTLNILLDVILAAFTVAIPLYKTWVNYFNED